jgi:acyl-CoA synthetase (AMP-forming)/AMP-acid ligase II
MIFRSAYPDVVISELSLTPFVLRHAEKLAPKPALIDTCADRMLTYGELAQEVKNVASGLYSRGMRKGDVFGIYSPNSIEYAVALLAIASFGGIATTINHLSTAEELTRQLADAGATRLLTTSELLNTALLASAETGIHEVFVTGEADGAIPFAALRCLDNAMIESQMCGPDDVVLLPYSSGTTGMPKGVMITHGNLVANFCQAAVPNPMTPEDVTFCLPPFFHIFGAWVLTRVLSNGGTVVFAPRFELESFLSSVERYRVTRAYLVPPVVISLVNDPIIDAYDLTSLTSIFSGAAPLGEGLGQRCQERLGCSVSQGYGLTETSPATHIFPLSGRPMKQGSVGPCVPNTECKVMDIDLGNELGPNERGELWIRGPQVMKGYLNRPEATANMITGDGWLHTGDIGYADNDGDFYIVDRLKELIKYKAYQVAPAELEALLMSHPAVADAAVTPYQDEACGEIPKAWIVLKDEATADELMAFVASKVAPYKKIRRLEFTDQIPKSASGKILRRVLVERDRAALVAQA